MRWGGIALALTVLAGCNGILSPGTSTPVETLTLRGDIVAKGPRGYCVDSAASQPQRGLALIAACATLKGEGAIPWRNAVIAMQVGGDDSASVAGSETAMAALLETPQGATLLSRDGNAAAIDVQGTTAGQRGVTVVFTDTGPLPLPGTQQAEWRGFLDINGRLVTIGLRGLADDPLTEGDGLSLLRDVMAAVRAANLTEG